MKPVIIEQQSPGCYKISGNLTFATINHKTAITLEPGIDASIKLDFKNVEMSDSAGLALIIEWLKAARAKQTAIHLENLPKQLLSLAELGGINSLLFPES